MKSSPFQPHAMYIESLDPDVRPAIRSIQAVVKEAVPEAAACISYNMPAFKTNRVFFYFAAFKKHIGVYPPVTEDADLIAALTAYRGGKGNLCFPRGQALPLDLIGRVAVSLEREYRQAAGRASSGRSP